MHILHLSVLRWHIVLIVYSISLPNFAILLFASYADNHSVKPHEANTYPAMQMFLMPDPRIAATVSSHPR